MTWPLLRLTVWALVSLIALDCGQSKNINTFAGPFILYVNRIDMCPSNDTIISSYIRFSHFNPAKPFSRQLALGNFTFRTDFTDEYWAHIDMAVRSNNQWKENAFVMDFPKIGCTAWRDQMPDVFRFFGSVDKSKPCRILAGHYYFNNDPISWEFPNIKVMPYGRYRLRFKSHAKDSSNILACTMLDCEIIPKPS